MLPKAFKQVKQQVDIVGKGRVDHGGPSWKCFRCFPEETCHHRLCQCIYAHPSFNSDVVLIMPPAVRLCYRHRQAAAVGVDIEELFGIEESHLARASGISSSL